MAALLLLAAPAAMIRAGIASRVSAPHACSAAMEKLKLTPVSCSSGYGVRLDCFDTLKPNNPPAELKVGGDWLLRMSAAIVLGAALLSSRPALAIPPQPVIEPPAKEREVVIYRPPAVTSRSTARELQLAKHLQASGARMYGAYWCSHCFDQKMAFGAGATRLLRYVECAADGYDSERPLCQSKGIRGYPTWEIGGELYPGEKSLEALAQLSGFEG